MDLIQWMDQHNLPRPVGGCIPKETATYIIICIARRKVNVPVSMWVYLPHALRFRDIEA